MPKIIIWLKAYCVLMAISSLVLAGLFYPLISDPEEALRGELSRTENREATIAMAQTLGIVIALIFAAPLPFMVAYLVWPKRRSAFFAGFAAISAGFLTPFGWLATIPLVIFFSKPEVRHYYGVVSKTDLASQAELPPIQR